MNSKWTDKDVEILKKYYGTINYKEIQKKFLNQYSKIAIQAKARNLGISKQNSFDFYSKEEDKILEDYYGTCSNRELQQKFFPNRKISSIFRRAKSLKLSKDPNKWEDYEDTALKVLKSNRMRHATISKILGKSENSIESRVTKLGLADRSYATNNDQINIIAKEVKKISQLKENFYCNYKQVIGSSIEHVVTSALLQNGIFVFKPCVDGGRFDLIGTRDFKSYKRIQIKAASYDEKHNVFYSSNTKQVNSSNKSGKIYKRYTKDDIDFYVCCVPYWKNTIYIIPVENLIHNSKICYYPHRKKTFNKFTDLNTETFKEAFDLIK